MKRVLAFICCLVLITTLVGAATLAAANYTFTFRFKAGQILTYYVQEDIVMTLQVPGGGTNVMKAFVSCSLVDEVLAVSANGTADIIRSYEGLTYKATLDGKELPIKQSDLDALAKPLKLKKTSLGVEIPAGERAAAKGMNNDFNNMQFGFSSKPVSLNETWTNDLDATVQGLLCQIKITNRLDRVSTVNGALCGEIAQELRMTILPGSIYSTGVGPVQSGMVLEGSLLGVAWIRFNFDEGVLDTYKGIVNGAFRVNVSNEGGSYEMNMVLDVTTQNTLHSITPPEGA